MFVQNSLPVKLKLCHTERGIAEPSVVKTQANVSSAQHHCVGGAIEQPHQLGTSGEWSALVLKGAWPLQVCDVLSLSDFIDDGLEDCQ